MPKFTQSAMTMARAWSDGARYRWSSPRKFFNFLLVTLLLWCERCRVAVAERLEDHPTYQACLADPSTCVELYAPDRAKHGHTMSAKLSLGNECFHS